LKTKIFKHTFSLAFLLFLVACSTKRDNFLSRSSHALSTKYNILYNGQIGLDKGMLAIKADAKDNFWKRLPVERMQINDDFAAEAKPKNTDFELAETKATKAIQKHSMNIGGRERNSQIDEAYLLLGKSRYYDQRFLPALDAFNYILYKYPNSSNIYQAKIWREKTNMRLGNDAQVVKNISRLLTNKTLKNKDIADANALLSAAFLNLEEKDSAVAKLKIAEKFTKVNTEKARYRFILGQLYEELGKNDSAIECYQSVIAMKRKSERKYIIQAQAKKAQLFDFQKGDTTAFLKIYNDLIEDRENRPFLDVIFHQLGSFYDKSNHQKLALEFYNASLRKTSTDSYLVASNYRNIGNMYFKNTDYQNAAKYYDSTLVKLDAKTREYIHIQKVRKDLDEVIQYEGIAKRNDSIINLISLSESDRTIYFDKYIEALKKTDETKKIALEKQKAKLENAANNGKPDLQSQNVALQDATGKPIKKVSMAPPTMDNASINQTASTFYFYNPSLVAFGKLEFKKIWGNRSVNGNWRLSSSTGDTTVKDTVSDLKKVSETKLAGEKTVEEKYTADYYLKQLPKTQIEIDSIAKERNFAYYQLGVIYKEKFKEYELASNKLEQLLQQNPEEKLVLPAMYNLFKIYQITNSTKAEEMKNRISSQYPNSRYAQIINNSTQNTVSENENSAMVYNKLYRLYQQEQFSTVLQQLEELITQYSGDEIVPKFELLKANTIGKLQGLEAYKNAMQYVADNYPNSEEGKKAQEIVTTEIPLLENMAFSATDTKNWKIIYKLPAQDDKTLNLLEGKINAFLAKEVHKILSYSCDNYTEKEIFVTIHGINSEEYAKAIVTTLKEKFKVGEPGIVVSGENYKVIQIKKNLESYTVPKKS
jgi:tetratricopeptide (TPR) repeat protein